VIFFAVGAFKALDAARFVVIVTFQASTGASSWTVAFAFSVTEEFAFEALLNCDASFEFVYA
jgi:hypothetical protein